MAHEDPEVLLQRTREEAKRLVLRPEALKAAFDALDAALCAGEDLPEDWCDDGDGDDEDLGLGDEGDAL